MLPLECRKRHNVEYAAKLVHIVENKSPLKKRYTTAVNSASSSPSTCTKSSQNISKTEKILSLDANPRNDFVKSKESKTFFCNHVSVPSAVKFPKITRSDKETTSISVASVLNYPTELIPLTAEDRKLNTIQQLIAEKLRLLRREKLVLLKSPEPSPHETEISLTVVEVTTTDDPTSSEGNCNYTVLQEGLPDSSDLFAIILNKINEKYLNNNSDLGYVRQKNTEYAKQIETEVIKTMTTMRKKNKQQSDSEPCRDKRMLCVMFVDEDDAVELKPSLQFQGENSESDRRERQFTELFDNIFQQLSRESKKHRILNLSNGLHQKSKTIKVFECQGEGEMRRNNAQQQQFDTSKTLDNLSTVTGGPNGTEISEGSFMKIKWWEWPTGYCTKKLLPDLCTKKATSTENSYSTDPNKGNRGPDKQDDLMHRINYNKASVKNMHKAILSIARSNKIRLRSATAQNV